jgi:hypothetical protein
MTNRDIIKTSLLILLSGMIYLSGCSKSAATSPFSIVGTWTETGSGEQLLVNNRSVYDTTYTVTGGQVVYSFDANGYLTFLTSGHSQVGGYMVNADTLWLYDTSFHPPVWDRFVLTGQSQNKVTLQYIIPVGGDSVVIDAMLLTR